MATMNNAAMKTHELVLVWTTIFISLGYILRSGSAQLYGNSIFRAEPRLVWRSGLDLKAQEDFWSGGTGHPHPLLPLTWGIGFREALLSDRPGKSQPSLKARVWMVCACKVRL